MKYNKNSEPILFQTTCDVKPSKESDSALLMFIITLLFGELGIHKFMEGDKFMGLVYLFTVGLFGIGWLYDTIQAFVRLFYRK